MTESESFLQSLFGLDGCVAVVTGGSGVLGGAIAHGLAQAGARVAVLGRDRRRAEAAAAEISNNRIDAFAVVADVLRREQIERAREEVLERWGRIDILINAAGGNVRDATTDTDRSIFDLPIDAFRLAVDLNFLGTVLPCQIFGEEMVKQASGSIVNISSMSVPSALTRVAGYSAGKAAMENFTRWLAIDLARKYGGRIRVNAVAPGFFVAHHNRELLINPDGRPTTRGETILARTPMGRFGDPDDLVGVVLWLCARGAAFVTGAVIPVDGGFSAFSGV